MRRFASIVFFIFFLIFEIHGQEYQYSELWGESGEKWSPTSRLPDFSFAGYARSEKAIPAVPVKLNVKDFGAVGDGEHDDSRAFIDALDELEDGALYIPEGRYRITQIIIIRKPGIVIRGAGPDKSILYFPSPLNQIKPNWGETTSGQRTSNYSWSGGFFWLQGSYQSEKLTEIIQPAKRGDFSLIVESAANLQIGQEIDIFQQDNPDNSLAAHIYSGEPGSTGNLNGRINISLVTKILSMDENKITFDRPLRFDVELQWQPVIRQFAPTVTNSGIENLGFEFPITPYEGHFSELGYNAIAFTGVAFCWVKNIRIRNSDSGFFLSSKFCTIKNVVYESERDPDFWNNSTGHHGITLTGDDNLFSDFTFHCKFIHDITVTGCAGNVIMNGSGIDLCFDHHKKGPYDNLFTNIHAGKGGRLWKSGGGRGLGRHCAASGTFWNIRAEKSQKHPGGFGPWSMNLVALTTDKESRIEWAGRWFEAIEPAMLSPQNIYEAQLSRRLRSLSE